MGPYHLQSYGFENALKYLAFDSGDGTTWVDDVLVGPSSMAPSAPSLTQTPVSQVIPSGGSVSFCAAASGFPAPTYQWRFNGVNIPGATGACYNMVSTGSTNIGTYDVVTANSAGTNYSPMVTLAFADLKMLASVYLTGPVGKNYRIEAAPSVAPTNWVAVTNITVTTEPFIYVDYTSATNKMQFYRAVPQ